ncbi:MAG: TetR/AcrR family transcriptional regulator [Defluviitaleaceae bacterium]|nr:TetR/AcrR family transcriptional regulator [Defluviitaleaceae bacterium]
MQKKYNPEQTLQKIITVSAALFLEKGYDKTSMQDIVNALGMSKGAIFHHFNSKEAIFDAVMLKIAEEQMEMLKNKLANEMAHLTAKEKLVSITSTSLSEDENEVVRMMLTRIHDPKLIMGMVKFNHDISALLVADIIREGIEDGSIQTDYPDECAQVLMLLFNLWCDPLIFECDMPTYRRRLEYVQHLMKASGVDVVSDLLIEQNIKFTENIYEVTQ